MQAVGVIAEFNPLHNGHVYALQQAKKLSGADCVVVVMAGSFVQRGEPAIVDKWTRAQAALASGADLVVALPTFFSVQAASIFAQGAVSELAALDVESLAFGTEAPDVPYMQAAAKMAEADPKREAFKDFTKTYATQLNLVYTQAAGVDLSAPNLLLGMSYAQANLALGSPMKLVPFKRRGAGHDDPSSHLGLASGSLLRQKLAQGQDVAAFVPAAMAAGLNSARHQSWDDLWPFLRYRLQTASLSELAGIYTMSEGLQYRLVEQLPKAANFTEFLAAIKSKRYTYARLRRLCLDVVLNYSQQAVAKAQAKPYLQVLGFTKLGQAYLHQVKKRVSMPLVTRVSSAMLAPDGLLFLEQQADNLIETLTQQSQNYGRKPLLNF